MPALNYQKRFAALVESKKKLQTIREKRKVRPGQTLYHYTGQRTKHCRKLGEAVCASVVKISIREKGIVIFDNRNGVGKGICFSRSLDEFAQADGFKDWPEMRDWFRATHDGLPFEGILIKWD